MAITSKNFCSSCAEAFKLLTDLKRSPETLLDKTWIEKKQADLDGFLNAYLTQLATGELKK